MASHTYTPCSSSKNDRLFAIQNTLTSPYRLIPITPISQSPEMSPTCLITSEKKEIPSSTVQSQFSNQKSNPENWILENSYELQIPKTSFSNSSNSITPTNTSSIYNDLNTLLLKHGLPPLPHMPISGQLGITFHQKFISGSKTNSTWYEKTQHIETLDQE
nr:C3 protein [Grapevine red blotch virus]WBA90046.1 C3 protein [Grapevine red blotch virus]WBA90053.1 C3 protein [Grapevine red blotch virus]WBA90060.1 C3 protein [Grapevine red blotch virus]WBA90067.1 C3 protein [Grapevine red blotch virus]